MVLLVHVHAIFEDQIGEFDWLKENIGRVEHAVHSKSSPKSVYVMSREQNVVAKLATKDGRMRWRQLIPQGIYPTFIIMTYICNLHTPLNRRTN